MTPFDNKSPLTNKMIEVLLDCNYRELNSLEPCTIYTTEIKDLLHRGMLITGILKTDNGKIQTACYITDLGREYLSKLTSKTITLYTDYIK